MPTLRHRREHCKGGLKHEDRQAQSWATGWLQPRVCELRRALTTQLRNLWYLNDEMNRTYSDKVILIYISLPLGKVSTKQLDISPWSKLTRLRIHLALLLLVSPSV